jgi:hypothetical protein
MDKKDWNYIAKLEKAIVERYGEQTIANPNSGWGVKKEKEYLDSLREIVQRRDSKEQFEERVEVEGFFIPKKLLNKDSNRECPVCEVYSYTKRDDIYMLKFQCCESCFVQHIEGREDRWKKGWRPDGKNNTRDH